MNSRSIVKSALLAALLLLAPAAAFGNSADSTNIRVDTRNLTMTQLVITGPTSVPWGQRSPYTATLSYLGAAPEDVTSQCAWSVTGGPAGTTWWEAMVMDGNMLLPGVVSTVPLKISATITRDNGQISSNSLSVTVVEGSSLNVAIAWPPGTNPTFVRKSGVNFVWNFTATASGLALAKPGVSAVWYLDGLQAATGTSISQEFNGLPGTRLLKLVVMDSEGRTGEATSYLTFNVPASANEPKLVPALDPGLGEVVNENGNDFEFDPLKTPNGIVIVTHGLYGNKDNGWLRRLATFTRIRLQEAGRPPNIVVYGWGKASNPNRNLEGTRYDFLADIVKITPAGNEQGRELADWIRSEIVNLNIDKDEPVHLIGHSAGGFVMGECGWQLRNVLTNLRVSMLDTPYPMAPHLADIPAAGGKVDRYISSFFGRQTGTLANLVPPFPGSYDYVLLDFLISLLPTSSAHSYSHEWYANSVIDGAIGEKGFGWSPLFPATAVASSVDSGPVGSGSLKRGLGLTLPSTLALTQSDTGLAGFSLFGSVSALANGFTLTEGNQSNSGITLANYTMPVGAQLISFRFQFTGAGDGDFLVISHGETAIGYGADNATSESGEVTVNMPVEHLAGQSGDLVFRLMSRGSQNVVVNVTGITITTVDDADLDGLNNVEEATIGTNPLMADSDGDGIDDPTEINTTLTNPVLADSDGDGANDGSELEAGTNPLEGSSRFVVKSSVKAGANFTITWSSVGGKTYRIIRSSEPSFESYDVLGAAIPAAPPEQSFTDTGGATGSRMFYRVELEP